MNSATFIPMPFPFFLYFPFLKIYLGNLLDVYPKIIMIIITGCQNPQTKLPTQRPLSADKIIRDERQIREAAGRAGPSALSRWSQGSCPCTRLSLDTELLPQIQMRHVDILAALCSNPRASSFSGLGASHQERLQHT